MTQWRMWAAPSSAQTNADSLFCATMDLSGLSTTESDVQMKFYSAYACTDLRVEITLLEGGAVGNVTLRDDEADTGVSVAISASGWTEDVTDTATPAADSLVCYALNITSGMHGDNITFETVLMSIDATDVPIMGLGDVVGRTASQYSPLGTAVAAGLSESDATMTIHRALVVSNLRLNALIATGDWDVSPGRNGSASTSVTVNPTSAGIYEDTTGSETYAASDTAAWFMVRTSGNNSFDQLQLDGDTPETWLSTAGIFSITTRIYQPFNGLDVSTSVDDNYFMRIGSVNAGHLECFVSTAAATSSISARVDTTNSTNLTLDTSTSGYLEDLTGSDSIADGTSLQITAVATSGTLTASWVALECPWTSVGGIPEQSFHEPTYQSRPLVQRMIPSGPGRGYVRN